MAQLFQQRFFFRAQMLRCPHVDVNELVTLLVGVYRRESLSLQAEDLSALCARGYLDLCPSVDGGHFYLRAEYRIGEGEVQLVGRIQTLALQFLMLFFFYQYDEITGRTSAFTRVALSVDV